MKNKFVKISIGLSLCFSIAYATEIIINETIEMDKQDLDKIYKNYVDKIYPQKVKAYELLKKEETVEVVELIGTQTEFTEVIEEEIIEPLEAEVIDLTKTQPEVKHKPKVVNIIRTYTRPVNEYRKPPRNTRPRPLLRPKRVREDRR